MKIEKRMWFEAQVSRESVAENGISRKVKETYVVDALLFTDAEARVIEEISKLGVEFDVDTIKKTNYTEIVFQETDKETKFFRAKLAFIIPDEKTGREKKTTTNYLIEATDLHNAIDTIDDMMLGSNIDFEEVSVYQTNILDVFLHEEIGQKQDK